MPWTKTTGAWRATRAWWWSCAYADAERRAARTSEVERILDNGFVVDVDVEGIVVVVVGDNGGRLLKRKREGEETTVLTGQLYLNHPRVCKRHLSFPSPGLACYL